MKLTKSRLQQIIKEELNNLGEGWWPFGGDDKKKVEPDIEPEPEPEPEPELSRAQSWSQDLKFDITDKDLAGAGKYGTNKEKDLQTSFALGHLEGQGGREPSRQECYEAGVDCNKIRKRILGDGGGGGGGRSSADHRDYRRQPGESAYERSTRTGRGSSGRHSWEESIQRKPHKRRKK